VDSFSRLLALAQDIQRKMGMGRLPREEDLRAISNLTLEELGRRIGIRGVKAGEFAAGMFRLLRKDPEVPAVWSGIPCVLNRLSQSHTLVILTGNAREAVQRTLVRNRLDGYIREIIDGESPGSKAENILSCRKRFGFEANQTFMIGDALSDLTAGRKAGVITVAVTWGYQPLERLVEGSPNYIVHKPDELLEIIPFQGSTRGG
jgi:phosphoglycolate phosphatase